MANALLSAMTGGTVQLSVMNYQALASANVDLLRYVPRLADPRRPPGAELQSELLTTSIAPSTALGALADTLSASGQSAAAGAVQVLAAASASLPRHPRSGRSWTSAPTTLRTRPPTAGAPA